MYQAKIEDFDSVHGTAIRQAHGLRPFDKLMVYDQFNKLMVFDQVVGSNILMGWAENPKM